MKSEITSEFYQEKQGFTFGHYWKSLGSIEDLCNGVIYEKCEKCGRYRKGTWDSSKSDTVIWGEVSGKQLPFS